MNNSNEPGWTPWGAVMAAIKIVEGLLKTITQNERDPFIRGGFTLLAIGVAPLVIVGFVLVSFLLAIFKNRHQN